MRFEGTCLAWSQYESRPASRWRRRYLEPAGRMLRLAKDNSISDPEKFQFNLNSQRVTPKLVWTRNFRESVQSPMSFSQEFFQLTQIFLATSAPTKRFEIMSCFSNDSRGSFQPRRNQRRQRERDRVRNWAISELVFIVFFRVPDPDLNALFAFIGRSLHDHWPAELLYLVGNRNRKWNPVYFWKVGINLS